MLPTLKAKSQQNNDATYAEKVTKDEAQIDWHQSAEQISRVIRAFNPRPISYTNAMAKQFKNRVLRIIEAEVVNRQTTNSPGEVIKYDKDVCYVATSNGVINLKKVQLSGKKEVSIKDFNNAYQLIKLK
jgi:methionyl-tRNA formyltransferase